MWGSTATIISRWTMRRPRASPRCRCCKAGRHAQQRASPWPSATVPCSALAANMAASAATRISGPGGCAAACRSEHAWFAAHFVDRTAAGGVEREVATNPKPGKVPALSSLKGLIVGHLGKTGCGHCRGRIGRFESIARILRKAGQCLRALLRPVEQTGRTAHEHKIIVRGALVVSHDELIMHTEEIPAEPGIEFGGEDRKSVV